MTAFLAIAVGWPTGVLSLLLLVVMLYWALVLVGALDPGGGADGVMEGALEGGEGAADAAGVEPRADLASVFAQVPLTVLGSALVVLAWTLCALGVALLPVSGAAPYGGLGVLVGGAVLLAGALAASLPLALLLTRPLRPLFVTHRAVASADLVGRVVSVRSGAVDERFGQALLDEGGGLILDVVARDDARLSRGDAAVIVGYDPERDRYELEPLDPLHGRFRVEPSVDESHVDSSPAGSPDAPSTAPTRD